jgi:hypothetical protein
VLADRISTALARRPGAVEERFSTDTWLSDFLMPSMGQWGDGHGYGLNMTSPHMRVTEILATLPSYAAALRRCPPAFAAQMVRSLVLSQARFTFRNRPSSAKAGRTFGSRALAPLERPWPNATTGQMIARMEMHAGLAGNAYVTNRTPQRLRVLRPDWVAIIFGSHQEPEDAATALDGEIIGYAYANGGLSAPGNGSITGLANRIETLLPDEVAHWCADEETEILTADGWKNYRSLRAGDEALTLNHETGLSEWQPVSEVCIFPAQTRSMVLMEGNEFSSLTTENHRWPVERRNSRAGGYVRRWATSSTLSSGDRIPLAAYSGDLPTEAKWSDALVEVVAWFYTEGRFNSGSKSGAKGRGISIGQSHEKNPENLARIRAALTALFGPAVARIPKTGPRWGVPPCWVEAVDGDMTILRLSANAGDVVTQHAPAKIVATRFLRELTQAQLELFINVSLLADNNGPRRLAQKNPLMAEQFALACLLAGQGVSIRHRAVVKHYGGPMTNVRMLKKRHVYPQESSRPSSFKVETVQYEGHVWCPRTPNETWLARRRGTVYFTGNSPLPDPEGAEIGMSWITPAIRDIQMDEAATTHKIQFFKRGATPNLVVKGIPAATKTQFDEIVDAMESKHAGVMNAYRTLYLTAGADATVVGSNFRDMDLKSLQGATETRISFLSRVPASVLGISEGLSGSSLNAGNFGMARRIFADTWIYPTLQDLSAALAPLIQVPVDAELWFSTGDMPILREDAKDAADIEQVKQTTIVGYVNAGFTPKSAVAAVDAGDVTLLEHTDLVSVQLQPPGAASPNATGSNDAQPPSAGPAALPPVPEGF